MLGYFGSEISNTDQDTVQSLSHLPDKIFAYFNYWLLLDSNVLKNA